jgi:hypothetical protein
VTDTPADGAKPAQPPTDKSGGAADIYHTIGVTAPGHGTATRSQPVDVAALRKKGFEEDNPPAKLLWGSMSAIVAGIVFSMVFVWYVTMYMRDGLWEERQIPPIEVPVKATQPAEHDHH